MRLRNITGARQQIAADEFVVHAPEQYKGAWHELFGNDNPIHVEIGMGKGKFLITLAQQNPDINYIGIEKYSSVLLRAVEKRREQAAGMRQQETAAAQPEALAGSLAEEQQEAAAGSAAEPAGNNLWLLRFDAEYICTLFDTDEIDRIYLNFSDPWPKDRHERRRLTSGNFLGKYDTFLKKSGWVEFKTDNDGLFQFALDQAPLHGWHTSEVTWDLHHSEYLEGNVMTEYEEKFSANGSPIHRCKISR